MRAASVADTGFRHTASLRAPQGVRLLCLGLGAIFISYLALYLCATYQQPSRYPVGDFFALWSYGQVLIHGAAARLYDFDALHTAQMAMGMEARLHNPFPYPPTVIPFLWPFAALPYWPACLLWLAVTGALYLIATRTTGFGTLLSLLAPTTTLAIVAGQTGFLTAALLVGGLRLRVRRPVLAGLLFGLLTFKPQLGLMVPVALVAARDWRTIGATCATVAVLARRHDRRARPGDLGRLAGLPARLCRVVRHAERAQPDADGGHEPPVARDAGHGCHLRAGRGRAGGGRTRLDGVPALSPRCWRWRRRWSGPASRHRTPSSTTCHC